MVRVDFTSTQRLVMAEQQDQAQVWLDELANVSRPLFRQPPPRPFLSWTVLFAETGNPLYAWDAWCQRDELYEIPDWLLDFVDTVACIHGSLGRGVRRKGRRQPVPDEALKMLPQSLGLARPGRSGNAFRQYRELDFQALMSTEVALYIRDGDKPYIACENVANIAYKDKRTVRRAEEKMELLWGKMLYYNNLYNSALERISDGAQRT